MYIHEAIKEAMPKGECIRRRDDFWIQYKLVLFPTTYGGILLAESGSRLAQRWNPNSDALMADDWEVLPG